MTADEKIQAVVLIWNAAPSGNIPLSGQGNGRAFWECPDQGTADNLADFLLRTMYMHHHVDALTMHHHVEPVANGFRLIMEPTDD
jgi:hypothetical protein